MDTRITLTVDDEDGGRLLSEGTATDLHSILNDALKEYVAKRQPAGDYVAQRYGYEGSPLNTIEKVRSVERRNALATYLARGQVTVSR